MNDETTKLLPHQIARIPQDLRGFGYPLCDYAADEIERLREFVDWVCSRWGEQCHVGQVASIITNGGRVTDAE